MSTEMLKYLIIGIGALFAIIVIVYLILRRRMNSSEIKQIQQLREGTKEKNNSSEVRYQKLYVRYLKTPFLKRYLLKLRRRLAIINVDDEYLTRKQAAKILTNTLLVIIPLTILIILVTHNNPLLMCIILLFELFMVDTFMDGMVDKIDNKLLKEQIEFFSEIRHAYHEFNMVEEAIYQVAQDDDKPEMARQAEKIYEVLISNDPESELEKYYDIAPNSYLKEFAGISYLTKEFGDRKVDNSSLYLKNLNNITQEMQLEILKRDKLDYTFQSLSVISIVPILALEPIKNWAMRQFSFTESFYNGKNGMIVQILILILTFVCYILTRRLKDNGSTNMNTKNTENPWQAKLYKVPFIKKVVDLFIPRQGTKEHRKLNIKMKDAASKDKVEWIYINRIILCIVTFVASIFLIGQLHQITVNNVYKDPTNTYNIIGEMAEKDKKNSMQLTESDNAYIRYYKGKTNVTVEELQKVMRSGKVNQDYLTSQDKEIEAAAKRIAGKIKTVNTEKIQWFEVLLAMVFSVIAYMAPIWMLTFQAKMRQMEMEDEVMQFNTIILMLMKIERVNVEIILEWLERYANIFKEPISKCVNNYESGAWEALDQMREEVTYQPFIRIIESLQAAVEKIPIPDAFDELDTERDYYQAKRKESNDRLITRKGMIGKVIGFAPMVVLFVGYLIAPMVIVGMLSMSSSFNMMTTG
ncbi:MAG: hypothetical protein IJ777_02195 [Clostridia bacterium]|nr:hypothetical protein [Clostridia bacterium]